jgi:hypothetical protein
MKIVKKFFMAIFATVMLVACSGDKTTVATELLTEIQQANSIFADMQVSEIDMKSVATYYKDAKNNWESFQEGNIPTLYKPGAAAQVKIASFLAEQLETNEENIVSAVLGTEANGIATGIYLYIFPTDISTAITQEELALANELTKNAETGEFYYINGNKLVTVEFVSGLDSELVFSVIDGVIAKQEESSSNQA